MRICSIEGCENKHSSIGLCAKHERRFRRYGVTEIYLKRYKSFISAYEEQVIKNNDSCWGWKGSVNNKGYGQVFCGGEIKFAHRFSYENFVASIPSGMFVCHHCDNPICSNPHHLFIGTNSDNILDSIEKGRFKRVPDACKARGEKVAGSKLKENEVVQIKKMIEHGFGNKPIAELFHVGHATISLIRVNKTWKHVKLTGKKKDE